MPGRGRGRRVRPGVKALMHTQTHGRKFNPGPNPPPIVESPWASATITLGYTGDKTMSGKEVAPVILNQVGFNGVVASIDFRIMKMRFWAITGGRPIRVSVFGWDNTGSATGGSIAVLEDWPGKVSYASVGYQPPAAMTQIVWSSDSTSKIAAVDVGSATATNWIAYFDVLWRGNSYTPIALTTRFKMLDLERESCAGTSSANSIVCVNEDECV